MSNFQCPYCGMTNIDCGKEGYKTHKKLSLKKQLKKIEKVIEPYQDGFEAEALSLPIAIESILERMKQKGNELLAEKNALQIGYDEHIARVKGLEKENETLKSLNKHLTENGLFSQRHFKEENERLN